MVVRSAYDLAEIVHPSLRVSVGAVLLATFVGRPLYQGGPFRFPGRPAHT